MFYWSVCTKPERVEQPCICVLGVATFSLFLHFAFGNYSDIMVFFVFHFIIVYFVYFVWPFVNISYIMIKVFLKNTNKDPKNNAQKTRPPLKRGGGLQIHLI